MKATITTTTDRCLPYVCPRHPNGQVLHTWDQNHYVLNGYLGGTGWKSNHRYECVECGEELAPPAESES